MRIALTARAAAPALLVVCAAASQATVLFDDFGPGNSFNEFAAWTVAGVNNGPYQRPAQAFTTDAQEYQLEAISVAAVSYNGTNAMTFCLEADNGGGVPDDSNILATWTITGMTGPATSFAPQVLSGQPVVLAANTQYWVVAAPGATDTWAGWEENNLGATGLMAWDLGGGFFNGTDNLAAMRVEAAPVPEPITLLVLGGATLAFTARRRRLR